MGTLNFKYAKSFLDDFPSPPITKFTFTPDGTLSASKFVGDGSGLTNIKQSTPLILDGDMESWTNIGWSSRILTPMGTVWATSNKSNVGDYYLGFGMTNTGWYFINRKDDLTKRYVCQINQDGNIRATRIKVEQRYWSDFVFNSDYDLIPIAALESYIKENKHLPGTPTEQEIIKEGLDLGDMQKLQMQKIEELTLYIFQLHNENKKLQERILKLENNLP
jgi:hypothetical protein